jgi:pyruvate carboxylase
MPRVVTDEDVASYLMYPRVWTEYIQDRLRYGDVSALPTPAFFYGMEPGEEITIDLERGKTLIVSFIAVSDPQGDGTRTVFFELNGQPRSVRVRDKAVGVEDLERRTADRGNPKHIGAPTFGTVTTLMAEVGREVNRGDVLFTLESMKMETVLRAERAGQIAEVLVRAGDQVNAGDLLAVLA